MKSWSNAIFPLVIMTALAGLTLWLRYVSVLPEERHDGKERHDPDYIVHGATAHKFDKTGSLQYTLTASEIKHYPDDESMWLTKPVLTAQKAKKPTTTTQANTGVLTDNNKRLDLEGDVKITRAASGKSEALELTTSQLTAFPDDEKAFTQKPVRITQGASWTTGVGMQVDQKAETYVLQSQARASIASKFAK